MIEHLISNGDNCEDLTVFKRQSDYIFNENKTVKTTNLILIGDIHNLYEQLSKKTGITTFDHQIINQNHIQNHLYEWVKKRRLSRLVPTRLKKPARDMLVKHFGLKNRHKAFFSSPIIKEFVEQYYGNDIAIHAELGLNRALVRT